MVHEAFCLDSQGAYLWGVDDFIGDSIDARWNTAGNGSAAVVDAQTGGICRLTSGAVNGNNHYITWGNYRSLLTSKKVIFEARIKLGSATYIRPRIGIMFDSNHILEFYAREFTGGATNWIIYAVDTGVSIGDSGIAIDTSYHIFKIESSSTSVSFYIDDVETANSPLTTAANIPNEYLQPWIYCYTEENANKTMDIDYVQWRQYI